MGIFHYQGSNSPRRLLEIFFITTNKTLGLGRIFPKKALGLGLLLSIAVRKNFP